MSMRHEWTSDTGVEYHAKGAELGEHNVDAEGALSFASDGTIFIVEASHEALRKMLTDALALLPTSQSFTEADAARLAQLEAAFEQAGGRGVELAEEIDALRRKRDFDETESVVQMNWTMADVASIAEQHHIDLDLAVDRAREWGRHITDSLSGSAGEQLENAVRFGQA